MTTLLKLVNQHAEVELDPDRGGEFRSFRPVGGENLLFYGDWRAPLSADSGPVYGSTERDWLSRYNGGWQVLFPNAGAESEVDGVPVAFHGEASLARLETVEVAPDRCALRAYARLPLVLDRTVRLSPDRPAMLVEESVTNIGAHPVLFLWGHHPTFPAVAGARIDAPRAVVDVEPTAPGPLESGTTSWPNAVRRDGTKEDLSTIPSEEQVRLLYLHGLEGAWAALRPPPGTGRPGVALSWDQDTFPNLWIWLQNADPGFPWYGRARMIGIEPQRAWPFDGLAAAIRRGRAISLGPGETATSWITIAAFNNTGAPVTGVTRGGEVRVQAPTAPSR